MEPTWDNGVQVMKTLSVEDCWDLIATHTSLLVLQCHQAILSVIHWVIH